MNSDPSDSSTLHLDVIEHNTNDEALNAAVAAAATHGGTVISGTVGHQGGRTVFAALFTYHHITEVVKVGHSKHDDSIPDAANRPIMPDHVHTIRTYLVANAGLHHMPPISLHMRDVPEIHVERSDSPLRTGFMVLRPDVDLYVIDGQHRLQAIREAMLIMPELAHHGLTVHIAIESNVAQIRDDLAVAALRKPSSPSLNAEAVMDHAEAVIHLAEAVIHLADAVIHHADAVLHHPDNIATHLEALEAVLKEIAARGEAVMEEIAARGELSSDAKKILQILGIPHK